MNRWAVTAASAVSMYVLLSLAASGKDAKREAERQRVLREAFKKQTRR